jgi:hypothetical protein
LLDLTKSAARTTATELWLTVRRHIRLLRVSLLGIQCSKCLLEGRALRLLAGVLAFL